MYAREKTPKLSMRPLEWFEKNAHNQLHHAASEAESALAKLKEAWASEAEARALLKEVATARAKGKTEMKVK
jgi:hypothetical protein